MLLQEGITLRPLMQKQRTSLSWKDLKRGARLSILLVASSAASPGFAQGPLFASPGDLLSSLYELVLFGSRPTTYYEPFFSDRVTNMMKGGTLGPGQFKELGFDPMVGLSEANLITLFDLQTLQQDGATAEAVATFRAGDIPVTINFSLVREEEVGWQIDDLRGSAGDHHWSLADLVEATEQ